MGVDVIFFFASDLIDIIDLKPVPYLFLDLAKWATQYLGYL